MKLLILATLFIGIQNTWAAFTIESVGGVSYYEQDATTGRIKAYGGLIKNACVGHSSNSLCNSCEDNSVPAKPCNIQGVHPDLLVTLTINTTEALDNVNVQVLTDGGTSGMAPAYNTVKVTTEANSSFTVSAPWSYFCQNDTNFASASCSSAAEQASFAHTGRKIYVYVDVNNDGTYEESEKLDAASIALHFVDPMGGTVGQQAYCPVGTALAGQKGVCRYQIFAGDSKLYIDDIAGPFDTDHGAPEWYGVAVFPAMVTDLGIIPNSSRPRVIRAYSSDTSLSDRTIPGLTNYADYCVLVGNINKAQNIMYYNSIVAPGTTEVCGQPSEVIGMLTDKSCFISTAAFGSEMNQYVKMFRQFRNEFLIPYKSGRFFVKKYYEYSPVLAEYISRSEVLKAATRTALYPWLVFAWLALTTNMWIALLLMFVGCGGLVLSVRLLSQLSRNQLKKRRTQL